MEALLYRVQAVLHYVYPVVIFVYFVVSSTVVLCTVQNSAAKPSPVRTKIIWYSLLFFLALYGIQVLSKIIEVSVWSRWPSQSTIIGMLSCILVFGVQQTSMGDATEIVWYPYYGSWLISSLFELALGVLQFVIAHGVSAIRFHDEVELESPLFIRVDAILSIIRFVLMLALVLAHLSSGRACVEVSDEERSPLLSKPAHGTGTSGGSDSGYGTNSDTINTDGANTQTASSTTDPESPWERQQRLMRENMEKRLQEEGSWIAYVKGFMVFFPYIWPVGNRRLQMHIVLVGLCLLANNGLNFLTPRQYGAVLDSLSGESTRNPWIQVIIFAALRVLASESGLPLLRDSLWIEVEYHSREALSVAAYSHVMNLSSEFHDGQSSSDIQLAISSGYHITTLLESICFRAVPMVIDLFVAFTYLSVKFGPYEGFITVATGITFLQAAARLVALHKEKRKKMVSTFYEEHYTRQAGIQGWSTVVTFNQVPYEEDRHAAAVNKQTSAYKSIYHGSLNGQALQYLILIAGLLAGAFLAVYQITQNRATAGDFVMLLTYWAQLTSPLQFFSSMGRNLSQSLVHVERLLEVMRTKATVGDKPGARPLKFKGGKVEFRNVSFSYDKKKEILKGVKLVVSPGTTVAFVGATGAGKSTIFKVLGRFYDVTGGSILIDGQDIRDVTVSSLRQCIGVVPQSPVLFDDTIMNNVRYARLEASDEEVYSACKAAAIHDQIMGFTEGYQTRVGERGIKISGGELQRLAIARAILKNPPIVLLDEATSAVDVDTEQKIQESLRALCKNRTTCIVAHRLSTVMNADVIFVVADGHIVEEGSHEELLAKKGKYAELWSKQIFAKPKNRKRDDSTETTSRAPSREGDKAVGEEPDPSSSPGALGPTASSTEEDTGDREMEDGGEVVKTPVTHKKEGSKLNPGAPEFTPRAQHPAQSVVASPICRNWAEDVENETTVYHVKSPAEDDGSSGLEWGTHSNTPRAPPNTVDASPEERKPAPQEAAPQSPDIRPRRNTMQSVSCPDPPLLSLQFSPLRSVSQPVPSPRVPSQPVPNPRVPSQPVPNPRVPSQPLSENIAPKALCGDDMNPPKEKASDPKPVVTNSRLPQPSTRGRGARGRGYRGRGRGRGRRNTSNTKQNQDARTTSAPQSASRPDRGPSAAA